jgi:RNA polymerase sigma-70 factor (ECF subfamily)
MGTGVLEEEAVLVEQAKTSAEAFHTLYELHLPDLYSYAYYRTGNRSQAEDVVSETFLQAWRAMPRYEQRGIPFIHWLYRIAGNVVAKQYGRNRGSEVAWNAEEAVAPNLPMEQIELRLDLLRHLHLLPDAQQQVLVLRYVQDLSVQDVARIMGKSPGAIKQLAFRALSALRERMGGYERTV